MDGRTDSLCILQDFFSAQQDFLFLIALFECHCTVHSVDIVVSQRKKKQQLNFVTEKKLLVFL